MIHYSGSFIRNGKFKRVYTFEDSEQAKSFANQFYGTIYGNLIIL